MRFYTIQALGKRRSITPEGFILCQDVPIARTGLMIYGPNETPIEPGPEGVVKVMRDPEDVFSATTIASFQGKPVTIDHPGEDVSPENWQQLTVGTCFNPRRGEGAMDDLLLADLLITRPDAIKMVQEDLPEVSCGYEADYEETGPGIGYQRSILGNHIALVENGRCGPRCAIGDHSTVTLTEKEKQAMPKDTKKTWLQRALDAFHAKDESAMAEVLAEKAKDDGEQVAAGEESGETHIHIHQGAAPAPAAAEMGGEEDFKTQDQDVEIRLAELEKGIQELRDLIQTLVKTDEQVHAEASGATGEDEDPKPEELTQALKDEAPEGLEEEAAKAKDSAYLNQAFRDSLSIAEILVPGIKVPTYDSAAAPAKTFKSLCAFRRQALDKAFDNPDTKAIILSVTGGKTLDTKNMSCGAIRTLFHASGAIKRNLNNGNARPFGTVDQKKPGVRSVAELNAANAVYWASKNK